MLALLFVVSACDNDTDAVVTEEVVVEEVTTTEQQIIADDDYVKASVVDVTKDSESNVYHVVFDVENRRNNDIDVGYAEIFGDGQSLSGKSSMSATRITPGATGRATLYVEELREETFPKSTQLLLSISEYKTSGSLYGVKDYPVTVELSE